MAEKKRLTIFPEMSGKILDLSHFKFHVTCKAKVLSAINALKSGKDFLKTLSKLDFSTDKRWLKNTCNDPNVAVLLEILEDYKKSEHRPNRAAVLVPLIEYAIGLYASDLFYRERGEWFMFQLLTRADRMQFNSVFIDSDKWYPKTRGIQFGKDGEVVFDYKAYEEKNIPIEQEYKSWYGVDVTKESIDDLPPEIVERIIEENRKYMRDNNVEFFNKEGTE